MKKLPIVLSVLLVGSVVTALMYARDAQRERARADALIERMLELEPVEKGGLMPAQANAHVESDEPAPARHELNQIVADVSTSQTPSAPKANMEFQGTLRARKQVEQLQRALTAGTPMQDYQIRALITAIDAVHREMQTEKAVDPMQFQSKLNEQIVQRAADILFESQLEVLISLLHGRPQDLEVQR